MKASRGYLAVAVLILMIGSGWDSGWAEEERVWTDSAGREIRAALTGFKDKDTLIFRLADGRSLPYPIDKLSAEDGALARKAFDKQAASDPSAGMDWNNPKQSQNYVIRGMRRQNAPGFVSTKAGWEWQVKCIEVKVQYKGKEETAPGEIRAYFYNREGKLLDEFDKPPQRQDENRKYIDAPEHFEKNKTVEAYFPLTPFLEESNWTTVLIAFGYGNEYSAKTMSGESFEPLEFAEKELLFPGWQPKVDGGGADTKVMGNVELEVRRVAQEEKYGYSLVFDGDYQKQKPCVIAEVRAKGKITPGTGEVKLYAFDNSGKIVGSRTRPSSAAVKGSRSYVNRPQIADDEWHPVFFALDGDLKGRSFSSYVVVFQFGGKTAAEVKSSTGATIETLEFPEKSQLTSPGVEQ